MEDCHKFEASLGYRVRPCFKNKQETKWRNTEPKGQELWAWRRNPGQAVHSSPAFSAIKCHRGLQRRGAHTFLFSSAWRRTQVIVTLRFEELEGVRSKGMPPPDSPGHKGCPAAFRERKQWRPAGTHGVRACVHRGECGFGL